MDDTQKQAEIVPEVQQDAAVPTAEQTPTTQVDGLPESASDRTKSEFDKLRNDLREERERREALESAFKTIQPKEATQADEPIYDPNTDQFDWNKLNEFQKKTTEAEQRAARAEQAVSEIRKDQEAREAYVTYPEANPDSKDYDKKLATLASGIILQSMLTPQEFGGKQFSLKEAYDYLKADTNNAAIEEAKKEGALQAIEQLTPKEQASLEATGTSGRRSDVGSSHETLQQRTRKGDLDAIAERMNRIMGKQE